MSILLSMLLAQARVLPEVDRRALDLQARAEAIQSARAPQPQGQRPGAIRRASGGSLDLSAVTTICRAAGNQADPAAFLSTLTRAYSLDSNESAALRTSCAAYLTGRADARANNYGAPAH